MFQYIFILSLVFKLSHGYLVLNITKITSDNLKSGYGSFRDSVGFARYADNIDWRDKDGVSLVKDQGECNACWAFAIVGTIESHARIHLGYRETMSEQFLIDCLASSPGCQPMSIIGAYGDIVSKLGGVLADRDYYPYEHQKGQCRWSEFNQMKLNLTSSAAFLNNRQSRASFDVLVTGFNRLPSNERAIADAVARYGPVTAAINPIRMKHYKGNYIDEPSEEECPGDDLEHTVVIVGYNTYRDNDRIVDYWIIKNSWGKPFGDNGYYYLVRGRNACGIAKDVSYPIVSKYSAYSKQQ